MLKLKNPWVLVGGGGVVLGMMLFGILRSNPTKPQTPKPNLNQETIAKLVKPGVVRIAQKLTGRYNIPDFEIDLNNLTTTIKNTRQPEYHNLNEFITGSGFIVSEDGYIITNAHVVSPEMIKAVIINNYLRNQIEEKLKHLTEEEKAKLFKDEEKVEKFANDFLSLLLQQSLFEVKSELAVLSPTSEKAQIENLFLGGLPAKLVDLNENFLFSNRDVALIKIGAKLLPTVDFAINFEAVIGSPVFVFGFPASAEFNNLSPVESTFTPGVISALKFSASKDFKLFQTDAKISQGSSGGPMFNQQGEVIGIMTYQSNPVLQALGDNFAFAIPITLAENLLEKNKIQIQKNAFKQHLHSALTAFEQNRCKTAVKDFLFAKESINPEFLNAQYFSGFIKSCEDILSAGKSIDTGLAKLKTNLKAFTTFEWFVILGRALLALTGLIILLWLYQKLKKDEAEIKILEQELQTFSTENNTEAPEELHAHSRRILGIAHPHLTNYVKEARAIGLSDAEIMQELKLAGWEDNEIQTALKV